MKLLTWNLDGLDSELLFERTVDAIPKLDAFDVVFLQEVVTSSKELIMANMPDYEHYVGASIPDYFVMILVKKSLGAQGLTANYAPFANSQMGRGVLMVNATMSDGTRYLFATSHLESLKEYAPVRMAQFSLILDQVKVDKDVNVVFGGDFNMRDAELKILSPQNLEYFEQEFNDGWVKAGSNFNTKF